MIAQDAVHLSNWYAWSTASRPRRRRGPPLPDVAGRTSTRTGCSLRRW